jgi:hypothetical protein
MTLGADIQERIANMLLQTVDDSNRRLTKIKNPTTDLNPPALDLWK